MANLFDKFIGIMGFGEDEPDEDFVFGEYEEEYNERGGSRFKETLARENLAREPVQKEAFFRESFRESGLRKKSAPVVSIHTQKQVRVIVVEPVSFQEAQNIADHLKSRRSVILNIENTDSSLAQRIVDFICGTTYALGGNMQKVGNGIFLFVPNNVDISGELNSLKMDEREVLWPKINS